ncbi:aromatic ring-hydroxylating dioxygenase subunit alpha [Brasilonema sp. UFV-L1]|uniref:aromatic ring-hydroxylating dioxygenase subunit alpha n=1 Tax=Brasilonema sp. UFV-L1 TaxID=2234130 RepID=UPI00145C8F52|nr:aromatic ring-hydroxylating dioxygenase subunit alpha [Brasilonema sp. UFV-L1]NMG08486.1 aromatic ring-hydroxylating dioxygenase subunit alpha [Brasilonema sp. UFV-L1]
MSSITEKVQQLKSTQLKTEVEKGAMNFPASWYIAMHSKDLGKKPMAIELFGQSLVAWRDQDNHPVIMDPYCSHKGASLAIGKVVDGCIQCPFHHWRYDSSGKCVYIPDVEHIPPLARQATYITVERYGYIWVWYGTQTPLFPLPEFPSAEDERDNYMPVRIVTKVNTQLQEAMENTFDYCHLSRLHKMQFSAPLQITLLHEQHSVEQSEPPIQKDAWFGYICKFPLYRRKAIIDAFSRALGLRAEFSTARVDVWPNGFILTNILDDKVMSQELVCYTPVAEDKTNLLSLVMHKKTGNFLLDRFYDALIYWRYKAGIAEDVAIWNTIKPSAGKAHVKDDWLILKYRSFYQSWVDKVE